MRTARGDQSTFAKVGFSIAREIAKLREPRRASFRASVGVHVGTLTGLNRLLREEIMKCAYVLA